MKSEPELESLIMSFLVNKLEAVTEGDISIDTNILAEGLLDSMAIMRLIAHIEESLAIKIPLQDLIPVNFISVQAMVSYLSANAVKLAPN